MLAYLGVKGCRPFFLTYRSSSCIHREIFQPTHPYQNKNTKQTTAPHLFPSACFTYSTGDPYDKNRHDAQKFSILTRGAIYSLMVKNVNFSDAGPYKCVTKNALVTKLIVVSHPVCAPTLPRLYEGMIIFCCFFFLFRLFVLLVPA